MDRAELEGYLIGVERRLAERTAEGPVDPELGRELAEARTALRAGRLREADERLRRLDGRLDALRPEMEMVDRPRGLVGYVPKGDRGVPPTPEEDALANRIRLVGRLASLRAAEGREVAGALAALRRAQTAYDRGDREEARRALDAAHRALDEPRTRPGG